MADTRHQPDTEAPPAPGTEQAEEVVVRGLQDDNFYGPPLTRRPSGQRDDVPSKPPQAFPARLRPKTLVLFSDGTGNSSAKAEKTNVWRLFQALDQSTSNQLALYDDGVGTSSIKYLAAIGGAFGWGLKRNVIDLYKFVCRNYVDRTTKIYAFGFSRGAFTIRVLTGLIAHEGLVTFTSEEELHKRALAAYGRFRDVCFTPPLLSPVWAYRYTRGLLRGLGRSLITLWGLLKGRRAEASPNHPRAAPASRKRINIEFLGLWDTVSAYGMPIAELKPVINWLFWPMNFTDLTLARRVRRACHALSLDDERTTFHPILWNQTSKRDQHRISQVWFAGVHSNLGGGYPEDQLSLVSLEWMMQQALDAGLRLQPECVKRISDEKSAYARIYDSRSGKGLFYRYSPRTIPEMRDKKTGTPVLPIIHGSVIARMARGSDGYVPGSLPPKFLVLAPNGELLPMEGFPDPEEQRSIDAAPAATPQILDPTIADLRTRMLKQAMQELSKPDEHLQKPILNTIWWRRVAWVSNALLALLLVLFPWFASDLHDALDRGSSSAIAPATSGFDAVRDTIVSGDKQLSGLISQYNGDVASFIPSTLETWTVAIGDYPIEFSLIFGMFLACLYYGQRLRTQLRDFGLLAWHERLREPFRLALLTSKKRKITRTWAAILVVLAIYAVAVLTGTTGADRYASPLVGALTFVAAARLLVLYWCSRQIRRNSQNPIASAHVSQQVAQALRTNRPLGMFSNLFRKLVMPFVFGIALVYAILAIANRAAFDFQSAGGDFCASSRNGNDRLPTVTRPLTLDAKFDTSKLCWASGQRLQADTRYRITLTMDDPWFDKGKPTGVYGFKADNALHTLATPLKRWWRQPWFAPIVHVGMKGNQEHALRPCRTRLRDGSGAAQGDVDWQPVGNQAKQKRKDRKLLISEFTTDSDGELFLFVNDAVLAVPGKADLFYKNNRGTATVQIAPVHNDGQPNYYTICP